MEERSRIRHVHRIRITQKLDRRLDQAVIETCMTKATIVARAVSWFCRQESALRSIVLGVIPPGDRE